MVEDAYVADQSSEGDMALTHLKGPSISSRSDFRCPTPVAAAVFH
jgi:hypothetical protein